ncbi:Chitinase 4 [Marasmius tenuissimus]|uniref:Chitinase 4 n=1 Tax=Marasmius tenuissimus TaxID=585030 RepID=A0ABR2Z785_9AGAR
MAPPSYEPLPTTEDEQQPNPDPNQSDKKRSIKRPLLLFAAFILVACVFYQTGRWSVTQSPSTSSSATPTSTATPPESDSGSKQNGTDLEQGEEEMSPGKYSIGYFVNWGIYGRKFPPSLIPVQDLTHVLYAFANVNAGSGEVHLSDKWADQDIHYPGDSWNDNGHNLYGNFKAIYNLKKANRHLKVLLSIGGWTYSPSFHPVVVSPHLRAKFVESSIKLLEDYGLDGLDVDYEYPQNDEQARGYVSLLKELREALDRHANQKGCNYRFLLTIAAPCGPQNYEKLHIRAMDQYLDLWNMMSYDFAGSWDQVAGHQANLYGEPISAHRAITHYINHGVAPKKIIMGMPLYGRSFLNTQGPGAPYSGVGIGTWENGVYDYRTLPLPGSFVMRDDKIKASWTYDYTKKEMISFDSEEVGEWKGQWIRKMGLGGSMFWELSGDKGSDRDGMEKGPGKDPQPGRSLVRIVKDSMGGLNTREENWLRHVLYSFANINAETGEVHLTDKWADEEIHYADDSWDEQGQNLYGNLKALYKLKQANRHLKVVLSIGGWSYSSSIHPVVVSPELRANFVQSAIRLLEDYGLDGLDVDYEFPQDDEQAWGYVELVRGLREALDNHASQKGCNYRFLLTIAAPCGPSNYEKLHVSEMDEYLDHWNLMAYDFAGSWDQACGHQANLYGGPISIHQAVSHYMNHGVAPHKLILGIPLYGRSFLNTEGPGASYSGVGCGTWEEGSYDYRALPLPGAEIMHDEETRASWTYDPSTQEMVTFDSEDAGRWKGEWIQEMGLGGSMFWELSGDKGCHREGIETGHGKDPQPGQSLVSIVKEAMGGLNMEEENWLSYEGSKFDNMRAGMP